MALTTISSQKSWLHVKNGLIHKYEKNAEDEWVSTEYKAVEGFITDINVVDKKDYQDMPFKELQIHMSDEDENYILCSRMFKPFSDGLLLSLANADLTRSVKITPYKGKETNGKAPVYCSVRYHGEKETIKWIEGIPPIEKLDQGSGDIVFIRKDRNAALLKLIDEVKQKYHFPKTIEKTNSKEEDDLD